MPYPFPDFHHDKNKPYGSDSRLIKNLPQPPRDSFADNDEADEAPVGWFEEMISESMGIVILVFAFGAVVALANSEPDILGSAWSFAKSNSLGLLAVHWFVGVMKAIFK